MGDNEKELLKAGFEAALEPFADIINKLFGEPAEEIGGMWKDSLATRRLIRRINLLKKLKTALADAGFEPQQIPDNIWIPALQEASLQDDESLQEKWANLLANAADPRQIQSVLPSFSSILKEFTSREAHFLDAVYNHAQQRRRFYEDSFTRSDLATIYVEAGLSRSPRLSNLSVGEIREGGADLQSDMEEFTATIDILVRNRILGESATPNPIDLSDIVARVERGGTLPQSIDTTTTTKYYLTDLGTQFVKSCRAPMSQAPDAES